MIEQILVIDDDDDDREIFSSIVEDAYPSISISVATNGLDAFEKLEQCTKLPDLIFLDLNMPVMNGRQFLGEIKRNLKWQQIPVVILTTSSDKKTFQELQVLGASQFITKPDKLSHWEQLLHDFFQNS
jgi:CheY-like chemotaxis protein